MRKILLILFLGSLFSSKKDSFKKILSEYTFVGDFNQKNPEPSHSNEVFWRYPFDIPSTQFPIEFEVKDIEREIPVTQGAGRAYEHINQGRIEYLSKNYEAAKDIWVSGREQYRQDFAFNRRLEYLIGMAFLGMASDLLKKNKNNLEDPAVKNRMVNASTFLSWAFIVHTSQKDDAVDALMPKGLYNLATIYFTYQSYAAAFAAADKGLEFLNRTGLKDHRSQLRQVLAEGYIKNRTPLEAVQEFDTAIRQDPNPEQAAKIFNRVGDIYYSLNNFDLAVDAYELSESVAEVKLRPVQIVLHAEALFWMGRFQDAKRFFNKALETSLLSDDSPLTKRAISYAKLRLADCDLAQSSTEKKPDAQKNFLESAKLNYFRVISDGTEKEPYDIASVRSTCLELPSYNGNNVKHGRDVLEISKSKDLHPSLTEMAWACHVASFAERERTESMLDRVREFYSKYPTSKFLQQLIGPVRETQAQKIWSLFEHDRYKALDFFEKNEKNLFPKISDNLKRQLFNAYIDVFQSQKAVRFWQKNYQANTERDLMRQAAFFSEMSASEKKWQPLNINLAKKLTKKKWSAPSGESFQGYLSRIEQTPSGRVHIPWIYEATLAWALRSEGDACGPAFAMLSQYFSNPPVWTSSKRFEGDLNKIMQKQFPKILESDPSCAQSYLDLEMRAYQNKMDALTANYLNRGAWLQSPIATAEIWLLAEKYWQVGRKNLASSLYNLILEKGAKTANEYRFAKARLDPQKTELEGLWQ